jgi:hypothetical protein
VRGPLRFFSISPSRRECLCQQSPCQAKRELAPSLVVPMSACPLRRDVIGRPAAVSEGQRPMCVKMSLLPRSAPPVVSLGQIMGKIPRPSLIHGHARCAKGGRISFGPEYFISAPLGSCAHHVAPCSKPTFFFQAYPLCLLLGWFASPCSLQARCHPLCP